MMQLFSPFPEEYTYGLYIHLPFCNSKCPYCQFVSMTGGNELFEPYFEALHRELDLRGVTDDAPSPRTVYIGGGTPSLIPAPQIASLLRRVSGTGTIELSIEANPESITPSWLESIRDAGITRLSIGVQSLDDRELAALGRIHTADCALEALHHAAGTGFDSLSADIIFGIPGQTLASLSRTLESLIEIDISHLSCYGLSIEEDTAFWKLACEDKISHPDPDMSADMYLMIDSMLQSHGFERYEISNYAKPGHTCRHNEAYWDFTPYLGIGASAHSFDGGRRFWNTSDISIYMRTMENGGDPAAGVENTEPMARLTEEIMLSLRTRKGLSAQTIETLPGTAASIIRERIGNFVNEGYLEQSPRDSHVLTAKGAVLADEIIAELTALVG